MIYREHIRNMMGNAMQIKEVQGIPPLSLPKSKGKALKDYKVYGNSYQRLPQEYQEVEYIESTGTQWIDTGLTFENSTKIEFTINRIDINANQTAGTSRANVWFGNNGQSSTEMLLGWGTNGNMNYFRGTSGKFESWKPSLNIKYHIEFTYEKGNGQFYVDGVKKGNTTTETNSTKGETILLGAVRDNVSPSFIYCKEQFHNEAKMWNGDILIRDFIPCYNKTTNVIGLYDLVEDKFYTNSGTGTFLKGADVKPTPDKPIEIESVGDRTYNLVDKPDNVDIRIGAEMETYNISGSAGSWFTIYQEFVSYEDDEATNARTGIFFYKDGVQVNYKNTPSTNYHDGVWRVRSTSAQASGDFDEIKIWWNDYSYPANMHRGFRNCMLIEGKYTLDTIPPFEPYGYKIPIEVKNGTETITTNIYLNEPLRRIGDYADYIDFKNQKVVRKIKQTLLSNLNLQALSDVHGLHRFEGAISDKLYIEGHVKNILCNKLQTTFYNQEIDNSISERNNMNWVRIMSSIYTTVADLKTALGDSVVYYPLATPTEESITLPPILTAKGDNTLDVNTKILPSNVIIRYIK